VQDWQPNPAATAASKTTTPPPPADDTFDPLANLSAITDDDDEDGLFELAERAEDAMKAAAGVVGKMTEAVADLGEKLTQRANEIENLTADGATPDAKTSKRVSSHLNLKFST